MTMVIDLFERTNTSLLPVTIAFAAGIGAASCLAMPQGIIPASLLFVALLLYLARRCWFANLLLLAIFFLTGLWHGAPTFTPPADPNHIANRIGGTSQEVVLSGVLAETPDVHPEYTRLLVAVETLRRPTGFTATHGLAQLTVYGTLRHQLRPGDRLLARIELGPLRSFQVPGAVDYRSFMGRQGIWVSGWAASPLLIEPVRRNQPDQRLASLRLLPEQLRDIASSYLTLNAPDASVPLYLALLTGLRNNIPPAVLEHFKASGAMHLLAISGMHLGLVVLLITAGLSWLLKRSGWALLHLPIRKTAILAALPVLIGYAAITGLQPPAVRALIMVLVFMAALLLDRQWCSLNNLAIAALLILIADPASLFSASFQLSFAATGAIILAYRGRLAPSPIPTPTTAQRLRTWIVTGLFLSLIATLATAPLSLYYFNRVALLSPLTTLLITPLLCFWAIPLGLAALATAPLFPALAAFLLQLGAPAIGMSQSLVANLAAIPHASWHLPSPSLLEIGLAYGALGLLLLWRILPRARPYALVLVALLLISPVARQLMRQIDSTSSATFLDVGQGNAVVVELPRGKTILIDGGGAASPRFNVGERLIAPYLWKRGISTLDAVVISHPHADHWNGLPFILEHFEPKTLWINGGTVDDPGYQDLLDQATARQIPIRVPQAGEILCQQDGAVVRNVASFHPLPNDTITPGRQAPHPSPNNQSLVLQLQYHRLAALFPGDIDADREEQLVEHNRALRADVLLATHHGSRFSNSPRFIDAVRPRYVIVSANDGAQSRFPDPQALRLWQAKGIPVFITGKDGSIRATMAGEENLAVIAVSSD